MNIKYFVKNILYHFHNVNTKEYKRFVYIATIQKKKYTYIYIDT